MRLKTIVAAAGVIVLGAACAADIDAGRRIADAQCASCHGKDGRSPIDPSYPLIAGQYSDYLLKALQDYHTGARKNPIMGAIAKPLSAQDMRNLAAFYASLPGGLTHRR